MFLKTFLEQIILNILECFEYNWYPDQHILHHRSIQVMYVKMSTDDKVSNLNLRTNESLKKDFFICCSLGNSDPLKFIRNIDK